MNGLFVFLVVSIVAGFIYSTVSRGRITQLKSDLDRSGVELTYYTDLHANIAKSLEGTDNKLRDVFNLLQQYTVIELVESDSSVKIVVHVQKVNAIKTIEKDLKTLFKIVEYGEHTRVEDDTRNPIKYEIVCTD